jgi:hypothetical protein
MIQKNKIDKNTDIFKWVDVIEDNSLKGME